MADLGALYREYGLRGIIPHAFRRGSEGYRYLMEKLQQGETFYLIRDAATNTPRLTLDDGNVAAYAFGDGEQAARFCALPSGGIGCVVEEAGGVQTLIELRDLGVSCLMFDEAVRLRITDIVRSAEYDGFRDLDSPIRNEQVNAALYLACQASARKMPAAPLFVVLFRLLKEGRLALPVSIRRGAAGTISMSDLETPFLEDAYGEGRYLYAFTDTWHFCAEWERNIGLRKATPQKLSHPLSYDELRRLVLDTHDAKLILNPGTANLLVARQFFMEMESAVARLDKMEEPGLEREDLLPDFLKDL